MAHATSTRPRDEIVAEVCALVAGGASVASVFAKNASPDQPQRDLPDETTFWRWVAADDAVHTAYVAALKARALVHAERLASVTEQLKRDPDLTPEKVAVGRLESDNIKWTAARMLPKLYGDKTILSNDPDNPIPPLVIIGPHGTSDGQG